VAIGYRYQCRSIIGEKARLRFHRGVRIAPALRTASGNEIVHDWDEFQQRYQDERLDLMNAVLKRIPSVEGTGESGAESARARQRPVPRSSRVTN